MAKNQTQSRAPTAPARVRALSALGGLVCGLLIGASAHAERFEFVALGDTAYNLPGATRSTSV